MATGDSEREAGLADDWEILPDRSGDDSDEGWDYAAGRRTGRSPDDQRLLDERPPHWD